MRVFSFSSLVLSYFLVAGGMFTGTLLVWTLQITDEVAGYAMLGGGAFVGAFVAARASRGQTLLEPALGAVAVIATILALAARTDIGKLIWVVAHDATLKFVGTVGGTSVVGAFAGAFVSERLLGTATQSSVPWVLYTAMSTFGAALLGTLIASFVFVTIGEDPGVENLTIMVLIGIVAGCLLAGIAVGCSARSRPLIAAFLGGGGGVAGFFYLIHRLAPASEDTDLVIGIAVLAGGGAIVTFLGTALGWAIFGRRHIVRVYDRATE